MENNKKKMNAKTYLVIFILTAKDKIKTTSIKISQLLDSLFELYVLMIINSKEYSN